MKAVMLIRPLIVAVRQSLGTNVLKTSSLVSVCPEYVSHQTRTFHKNTPIKEDASDIRAIAEFQEELNKLEVLPDKQARKKRNIKVFKGLVDRYLVREGLYHRGHVEFANAALKQMKAFGVEKDLSCYKKLLEVFPEGKLVPKTIMQVEGMHYPKQQNCAIEIMALMESNFIIPDKEFSELLSKRFGKDAHCYRRLRRMLYWMPKFRHMNPYRVPRELPEDPVELAVLALKKMAVDVENKITVWKTSEAEQEPLEDTFIVSSQSPAQQALLQKHKRTDRLYVEGGYRIWLREIPVVYHVLRAEADPNYFYGRMKSEEEKEKEKSEDLFEWVPFYESEENTDLVASPSVHEQEGGTIMATCVTGTRSKDSLITWIRYLQQNNPVLENIPIMFSLTSLEAGLEVQEDKMNTSQGRNS